MRRIRTLVLSPAYAVAFCLGVMPAASGFTVTEAASTGAVEAPAAAEVGPEALEGFWEGQIIYAKAEIELDFSVELAPDAEGTLVGSINVPSQKMKLYPLTTVSMDGSTATFDFHRDSERTKNARFLFEGELGADGMSLAGIFTGWYDDDGRNKVPFVLTRTGEAFVDSSPEEPRPLTILSDDGSELRDAFNRHRDHPRLVLLLSPT